MSTFVNLFCPKLTVCIRWSMWVSFGQSWPTTCLFGMLDDYYISICVVSMTVKFEGTVSGIPWSDESLAVLSSWGQFNLNRSHASTAWVEAALSTPWIIGTAFWSWLLAFVSRERGVLLSQYEWAPRTELLRDVAIISVSSVWYRW